MIWWLCKYKYTREYTLVRKESFSGKVVGYRSQKRKYTREHKSCAKHFQPYQESNSIRGCPHPSSLPFPGIHKAHTHALAFKEERLPFCWTACLFLGVFVKVRACIQETRSDVWDALKGVGHIPLLALDFLRTILVASWMLSDFSSSTT